MSKKKIPYVHIGEIKYIKDRPNYIFISLITRGGHIAFVLVDAGVGKIKWIYYRERFRVKEIKEIIKPFLDKYDWTCSRKTKFIKFDTIQNTPFIKMLQKQLY